MPDYVYLLENRLSTYQQAALRAVRDAAREAQMPVFLVGDAVRDLVCGNSVREFEVVLHGNTAELKKPLTAAGAAVWWENSSARRISLRFPGSVLLELSSARHADYPKCGKPVYTWASIHEDLRSRDFTVNAMAISLNDGSYGLLMDPLNGVADIEVRQLRLVSNFGFLEEPSRMVRASRLRVRLGFQMEERTQRRYDNARDEGMMQYLSDEERKRELEQIVHEEEALQVMAAHEAEGWMKALHPAWTTAKVDAEKLQALHDFSVQLQMQGVHADLSALQAHYLTAKLAAKDLAALKEKFLRPGFVKAWEGLDASAAQLAKTLLAKENARPSACFKLLSSFAPEVVVWLGLTTRQAAVKEKYDAFLSTWPAFRQKLPFALMAEMRITSDLPGYADLAHQIFLRLIDGELGTDEEMRAFLEPFSPPAPPPPVSIKRSRSKKAAEVRIKSRVAEDDELDDEDEDGASEIEEDGVELDFRIGDSDEGRILGDEDDGDDDDVFAHDSVGGDAEETEDDEDDETPAVKARKGVAPRKASAAAQTEAVKPVVKETAATTHKSAKKATPAKKVVEKVNPKPTAAPKPPTAKQSKPAIKPSAKKVLSKPVPAKAAKKTAAKAASRPASQTASASRVAKGAVKTSTKNKSATASKAKVAKGSKDASRKAHTSAKTLPVKAVKKIAKVAAKKKR